MYFPESAFHENNALTKSAGSPIQRTHEIGRQPDDRKSIRDYRNYNL